jgi:hypothetical protein
MNAIGIVSVLLCFVNVVIYSLLIPHGGVIAWGFAFAGALVIYRIRRQ